MGTDCEEIRELTAEVALGIATGEERARAIEHIAGCRECRRELQQLTAVTDELLLLAPEIEPPRGFEERALSAMIPRPAPRPRRNWTRRLLPVGAALATGAVVASFAVALVYRDDHRLASDYRHALAAADGSRFVAMPLRDGAGVKRGSVSLYKGRPSWLVVALSRGSATITRAEVVTRSGQRLPLRGFALRNGVWGGPIPAPFDMIASVQLIGPGGRSSLVAFNNGHW